MCDGTLHSGHSNIDGAPVAQLGKTPDTEVEKTHAFIYLTCRGDRLMICQWLGRIDTRSKVA